MYHHWQHTRTAANPILSPPHNVYRFYGFSSFLWPLCMSFSVIRGLDGLWSPRYSLIRLEKGKTVYTLRLHVCHGEHQSTRGCLDTEILTVKFSYYATTYCTTFCAERNDCVWFDGTICEPPALVYCCPQSFSVDPSVWSLFTEHEFALARVQIWTSVRSI